MVEEGQESDARHDYGDIESGKLEVHTPPTKSWNVTTLKTVDMVFGIPQNGDGENAFFKGDLEIEYESSEGNIEPMSLKDYAQSYEDCTIDPNVVAKFVRDDVCDVLGSTGQDDPDVFVRLEGSVRRSSSPPSTAFRVAGQHLADDESGEATVEVWTSGTQ